MLSIQKQNKSSRNSCSSTSLGQNEKSESLTLLLARRSKRFSRIMAGPNGLPVLVYFELVEKNGHLVAKALYYRDIPTEIQKDEVIALPAYFDRESVQPILSPFFADVKDILKDLVFIVSQPTRAPSI